MFGSTTIGLLLFVTHILACITVGLIFRFWKSKSSTYSHNYSKISSNKKNKNVHLSNLGEVLASSITSAISSILMIGGFVVIFSSIISILRASNLLEYMSLSFYPIFEFLNIPTSFIEAFITGFLEITNGISQIANLQIKEISINIIFTAFLLGFGGISILLQVLSITSKTDLSIKPYIYGKLLHGTFAALYTFIAISVFPMLNFNL